MRVDSAMTYAYSASNKNIIALRVSICIAVSCTNAVSVVSEDVKALWAAAASGL